jgi:hypothetical protein
MALTCICYAGKLTTNAQPLATAGFVRAGEILYRAFVALDEGDTTRERILRDDFRELVPYGTYEIFASRLARADD